MIVVVCLNPAIDITYGVDTLVPGRSHRVLSARQRAGGKGVNVAHVLSTLDVEARLLGVAGGEHGEQLRVATGELDAWWVPIKDETRRTVTVVSTVADEATVLLEAGPTVSDSEWAAVCSAYEEVLAAQPTLVVLAGSLPQGVPDDAYATLIERARERGVRSVLDADAAALRCGVAARPYLAKPNADEARQLAGDDPLEALVRAGAENAVVSAGAEGFVASVSGRRYRAFGPVVSGNPTGAGDALTAALAAGVVAGHSWHEVLRDAAATAAAAVASPVAGVVDPAVVQRLREHIAVEEL